MKHLAIGFIAGALFGFSMAYLAGSTLSYGKVFILMGASAVILWRGVRIVLDKRLLAQGL